MWHMAQNIEFSIQRVLPWEILYYIHLIPFFTKKKNIVNFQNTHTQIQMVILKLPSTLIEQSQ